MRNIDRYAWNAYKAICRGEKVNRERPFTGDASQYEELWRFCKDEAKELRFTPRDVEKALFKYGENEWKIKASGDISIDRQT